MAGDKNMSEPASKEELKRLRVPELRSFLKRRNIRGVSDLKRAELLKLAIMYFDQAMPVVRISDPSDEGWSWDSSDLDWRNVMGSKVNISPHFSIATIIEYLGTIEVSLLGDSNEDEEMDDAGTKKPVVKGRQESLPPF